MKTQETAYAEIEKLVQKFRNLPVRERKAMNEHATRQGFILPMFRALGWDIDNVNEVNPEEKVSRGFVDFSFRIGNVPRYFLETKKLDEDLNKLQWVQQAIDYAWTKSVTWALLSDFEGLIVFNAEAKADNPYQSRFLDFTYEDYLPRFEQLWWLSREQTLLGRLDTEADKFGRINKRLPVSQELFTDLKKWRQSLFNDIKAYTMLAEGDVDNAVLHLLNRLIFIRTAEDRLVEPNRLQALVRELKEKKQIRNLAAELSKLFREMDGVYNSELFAPHFSEGLDITPGTLEDVINGLYARNFVRYNFAALEADVLGTVYEQYLGAVVAEQSEQEPTKARKGAKQLPLVESGMTVQERRKKRKSQGIYYTPSFVTKYIVQQTVGKYLEENGYNPSKPPRILDMACGSGSFLIEAFDVVDKFVMNLRQQTREVSETSRVLDRARQLEVLTNCIYGVDKDKQALEVARLNLLLRALHSREKLPTLKNFHLGDSLRPETWEMGFPEVMKDGGFDIIIGNPPYVRAENMAREDRDYFMSGAFASAYGRFDIFILFVESAINLLKENGRLGFIVPRALLNQNYARELRKIILDCCTIEQIVDFGKISIFDQAAIDTCIIILKKAKQNKMQLLVITPVDEPSDLTNVSLNHVDQDEFANTPQFAFRLNLNTLAVSLVEKIKEISLFVGDICYVDMGLIAYYKGKDVVGVSSKESYISPKANRKFSKPYAEGKDLADRYFPLLSNRFIWYEPSSMHRPKFPELFETQKIVVSKITGEQGLRATLDENGIYVESTLNCCVLSVDIASTGRPSLESIESSKKYSLKYLLGIMNSKPIGWYYKQLLMRSLDVYPDNVRQVPIRRIDFAKPTEKAAHDEIVSLVEKMLALQKEKQSYTSKLYDDEIQAVERQIAHVDGEINQRVYRLYGLTEEEIGIVEG